MPKTARISPPTRAAGQEVAARGAAGERRVTQPMQRAVRIP